MDRVLVQKIKPSFQTKSGLFLPETAKGSANLAKVMSVGPGRITSDGARVAMSVKLGDTVVVPDYGGMSLKLEEEEYHVFRDEDFIGVMNTEE